jgi:hypothetical protein
LLQAPDRLLGEVLILDVLKGTTTPEGESLIEELEREIGVAFQMRPRLADQVIETSRIELNGVAGEKIGLTPGEEDLGLVGAVGLEQVPEMGHMDSQCRLLPPGLSSRPDGFDDLVSH